MRDRAGSAVDASEGSTGALADKRGLSRRELAVRGIATGGVGVAALRAVAAIADMPAPSANDLLRAAMSSELLAVFAYTRVSVHPGLTPTVARVTADFLAHERQHAQVLADELTQLGLAPPVAPSTADAADAQLSAHGGTMSFSELHDQRDCLKILQQVESVLEGAYFRAVTRVGDPAVLRTIAEIMAAEAQHWTALTGLRHPGQIDRAVPYAFVEGVW
jgi:bacterioferritin (cytochrome b1)